MSLGEKLDRIRAGGEKNIPAPTLEKMHRATAELQGSGNLDSVIRMGASLPAFELPNQDNEIIRSRDLLAEGPLIMTVYRGLW